MTLSINGQPPLSVAPEEITYEFGQEAIGYWLVVPAGGTGQVTFAYSGPFADISVSPERYQLQWIKQVNALHWPVDATITLSNGRSVTWSATLDTDKVWSIAG